MGRERLLKRAVRANEGQLCLGWKGCIDAVRRIKKDYGMGRRGGVVPMLEVSCDILDLA
jgi:hypothetical protein